MVAVEAADAPYIPVSQTGKFIYAMDVAGSFMYLAIDYVLTKIIDAY